MAFYIFLFETVFLDKLEPNLDGDASPIPQKVVKNYSHINRVKKHDVLIPS